eukprot:scaffold115214_cov34-Prasinocladus_malaysianus.AAC.1
MNNKINTTKSSNTTNKSSLVGCVPPLVAPMLLLHAARFEQAPRKPTGTGWRMTACDSRWPVAIHRRQINLMAILFQILMMRGLA